MSDPTVVHPADAAPAASHNAPAAPNGNASLSSSVQSAKDTIINTASSTASAVQNHPTVQAFANGPVAGKAKDEASKTSNEFQNLANARTTPAEPAATGQPLTHYHSLFYSLLSWENPRASGIAFASTILSIFAARYLNVLHYLFRIAYITLGTTALLEIAGKTILNDGLASRFRPRRYYTIPRESLERSLEDIEQLMNFFVIETQRIVFAENIFATLAAFVAALVSYGLIKVVPFWGLCLIGTCVIYIAPLIYVTNQKAIDDVVEQTSSVVNQQASQIRGITAEHTNHATSLAKSYVGEYTAMAQDYMGIKKSPASEHTLKPSQVAGTARPQDLPSPPSAAPMPSAPQTEPKHDGTSAEKESLLSH